MEIYLKCLEFYVSKRLSCHLSNIRFGKDAWHLTSSPIRLNRNLVWSFYVKTVLEFSQKNRQNVTREVHQGPIRGHGQVPVRVSGAALVDCVLYDEWLENEVYHNLWKVVTWHCLTWLPCCRPDGAILKLVWTSKYQYKAFECPKKGQNYFNAHIFQDKIVNS